MSRAFVKELAESTVLPDRPLSQHPNLVTEEGLRALDAEVARWRAAYAAAQLTDDEDHEDLSKAGRELRYWTARRHSAQLVDRHPDDAAARFGSTVTMLREDGRRLSFRIVGEDEADPAAGAISHVSPLARAILGKAVGEVVQVAGHEIEIEALG